MRKPACIFLMYYFDHSGKVHEIGFPKIYFWDNDEVRTEKYNEHTKETIGEFITDFNRMEETIRHRCYTAGHTGCRNPNPRES